MAQRPDSLEPSSPPLLAEWLLGVLTVEPYKTNLLGDLAESYQDHLDISEAGARRWYWAQTYRSLPGLTWLRLQSKAVRTFATIVLATLLAAVFIQIWDIIVARQSAYFLASRPQAPDLVITRSVYFLVHGIGFAIAGGVIARLAFTSKRSFWQNAYICLGPVVSVLLVIAIFSALASQLFIYSALKIGLGVIGLTLGAYIVSRYRPEH